LPRRPKGEVLLPLNQRTRPVKLNTVGNVLTEMQRLYRHARNGSVSIEDLTRLIFALEKIRGTLEATQLIDQTPARSSTRTRSPS
jgi:hypothetical protein